jgi:hypothetical protein
MINQVNTLTLVLLESFAAGCLNIVGLPRNAQEKSLSRRLCSPPAHLQR